ncbi:hypothetical protein [uncultured Paracoccus sp.]|uniref:hypothetical protein n=1 Tax=uncultured Paracoccus sp. TaxID=189685 RepID=UPI00260D2006|nr:hypothetical protein [uncultured Paracoccus sp.]
MPARRLWPTLRNLILALLNATLILVALCLWLAWRLTSEVHAVTADVAGELAQNLVPVQPLRDEVAALTGEVAGLRADLAAVREGAALPEAVEQLGVAAEGLQARLAGLAEKTEAVTADPGLLIDRAVAAAAGKLGDEAQELIGCRAAAEAKDG